MSSSSFVMVPSRSLQAKISLSGFRYYCWLCEVANRQGVSWWSRSKTADIFSVAIRTVTKWRSALENAKLIQIRLRYGRASIITVVDYPSNGQLDLKKPISDRIEHSDSDMDQSEEISKGTQEYTPDEYPEQETKKEKDVSNVLRPTSNVTEGSKGIVEKLDQMTTAFESLLKSFQDKSGPVSEPEILLSTINHRETIERLIEAARKAGLESWGARILELIANENRGRIYACSYLTDESMDFAFETLEQYQGTEHYPLRTWYWLERLAEIGSTFSQTYQDSVSVDETEVIPFTHENSGKRYLRLRPSGSDIEKVETGRTEFVCDLDGDELCGIFDRGNIAFNGHIGFWISDQRAKPMWNEMLQWTIERLEFSVAHAALKIQRNGWAWLGIIREIHKCGNEVEKLKAHDIWLEEKRVREEERIKSSEETRARNLAERDQRLIEEERAKLLEEERAREEEKALKEEKALVKMRIIEEEERAEKTVEMMKDEVAEWIREDEKARMAEDGLLDNKRAGMSEEELREEAEDMRIAEEELRKEAEEELRKEEEEELRKEEEAILGEQIKEEQGDFYV